MEPQSSPPAQYRSISQAAVSIALGGKYVRQIVDRGVLIFEIIPPPGGVDFDDPDLMVPVAPLLAWTEALATRVREHRRRFSGAGR